jgi:hypothetical protein
LVAKIFREKYYPGGIFLESSIGKRPSYAWRTIWNAESLLEERLLWNVGDGTKIKIWGDKWVQATLTHKIQVPNQLLDSNPCVSELINYDDNWQNVPMIESLFPADVVEQSCSMATSPHTTPNQLMWNGTRTGTFSVRSAYHLAVESKVWERGSIMVNPNANPVWQLIWRFQVPRVVQLFLWRACNDILPTKEKLFKRKVVSEPGCPTCGMEIKTTIHSL